MDTHQLGTPKGREYHKDHSKYLSAKRLLPSWSWSRPKKNSRGEEKRFRRLIEQAPDAFFSHDLQGNLLDVNEQTCQQLGYQRDEILALNTSEIQRGIEPELAKSLWQEVMNGETVLTEDILLRKDGSSFPAEVKIGLFKDGNIMEIFGFFRDISERKCLEEERETLIANLQKALAEVKTLRGIIPICSYCKKIRDDQGYWAQVDEYLSQQTNAQFSHGICLDCKKQEFEKYGFKFKK